MKTRREFLKTMLSGAGVLATAVMVPGLVLAKPKPKKPMLSTGEPGTDSYHEEEWKPIVTSGYSQQADIPHTHNITYVVTADTATNVGDTFTWSKV